MADNVNQHEKYKDQIIFISVQNNVVDLRYLKLLILLDQNQKSEKSKIYNDMLQKYKDLKILVLEKKLSSFIMKDN